MKTVRNLPKLFLLATIVVGFIFVFGTILVPTWQAEQREARSGWYGFPVKYLNDYFLYTNLIKSGSEGQLLWHNDFSEEYYPPLPIQPHYHVWGLLTRPLGLAPWESYFLARLVATAVLFLTTVFVMTRVIENNWVRSLAIILFLSGNSFWHMVGTGQQLTIVEPTTYSNWFNGFLKLTMLPPHHLLAIILFMSILFRLWSSWENTRLLLVSGVLGAILGFAHPYVANVLLALVVIHTMLELIITKKVDRTLLLHAAIIVVCTVPVVLFHGWQLFQSGEKNNFGGTLIAEVPLFPVIEYLKALGPLVVSGVLGIVFPSLWRMKKIRIIALWAYLPIILFYLPALIPIPTGQIRLFQTYQHIPLAILTAAGVYVLCKKIRFSIFFSVIILALISIGFGTWPYIFQYRVHMSPYQPYFEVFHLIEAGRDVFAFLDRHTEAKSIVMAPEKVSMLIPTFTHNRVILGHNNRRYTEKKSEIEYMYSGAVPIAELANFFAKYKAQYVIFGLGTNQFSSLPYITSDILQIIYEKNGVVVAQVK